MIITNQQKAILHVAKGKLGLSDAEYRGALIHVAGVTNSTELDMAGFEALWGFSSIWAFSRSRGTALTTVTGPEWRATRSSN